MTMPENSVPPAWRCPMCSATLRLVETVGRMHHYVCPACAAERQIPVGIVTIERLN